jgi:hypothetical protein
MEQNSRSRSQQRSSPKEPKKEDQQSLPSQQEQKRGIRQKPPFLLISTVYHFALVQYVYYGWLSSGTVKCGLTQ